jgi:hypothetical protein
MDIEDINQARDDILIRQEKAESRGLYTLASNPRKRSGNTSPIEMIIVQPYG